MCVKKKIDSTVAGKQLLMLLLLYYLYSWYERTTASAEFSCRAGDCIQTCNEYHCENACNSAVKQCKQTGYGHTKSSTLLCQARQVCSQVCSDGQCMLSCDQSRKCIQECRGKHCTATCNDGNGACQQHCITGNCSMICNSPICNQECNVNDCSAKCPHGVEECTQVCYVDKCDFSCDAKKCNSIDLSDKKNTNIWNDKVIIIATAASGGVFVILIITIIILFVKYRRRKKSDEDGPLLDQQDPVYEDVEFVGGAEPDGENSVPSNANFERSSQRGAMDNAGYLIPFVDNEGYTIPNSGEPHVHATGADEVRDAEEARQENSVIVVGNSALGRKKFNDEENSRHDGNLDGIVADLDEIQTEAASQDKTSRESALQSSSTSKNIIIDEIPPISDEPPIEVSIEEPKISTQCPSDQNDSGGDDIVLVYVLPNSDQKLDVEGQSEADGAAKISVENSRLQPSNGALQDDNSTDDVALVYIEPISDEPEPATCSQANGGDDVINDGGSVPGYQALDEKKREIEEKCRYKKLIKRKCRLENNVPSNARENFEHTSERGEVDSAGYLIQFEDNEGYTIPNSGEPHVQLTGADEVRDLEETRSQNSVIVVENSALGGKKSSKEENSIDDGNLDYIVADLEEIQTETASQEGTAKTSNESANQGSSTSKETILDYVLPASDEPKVEVSTEKPKILKRNRSNDRYSDGNSRSDDIVLVYVLPNSDQKLNAERQSEASEAAKISGEISRLQPSDGALDDDDSTDDVALVYIEPISDEPELATCSQANGGRQGEDDANAGGNVPAYQALNQKEREIEAKSRYQKLIKRKVV